MSLVEFLRVSDARPPARELVTVHEDGTLTGWRSIAGTVGRFAATVPDRARIEALVEAAVRARPPGGDLPLDATADRVEAGGFVAVVRAGDDPGGPWGALLAACRELLESLSAAPVAAVALVLDTAGTLRLEHRGDAPLTIELGDAAAEVSRWRERAFLDARDVAVTGVGRVVAEPGWRLDLSFEPLGAEPGDLLTASVRFVAVDEGVYIPVLATASHPIG